MVSSFLNQIVYFNKLYKGTFLKNEFIYNSIYNVNLVSRHCHNSQPNNDIYRTNVCSMIIHYDFFTHDRPSEYFSLLPSYN